MSHHVIQSNNQVINIISSCNCNVFNKHLQDIRCNDNLLFQSNNHFSYNILNTRLQYLDFTIAIAPNQYLQSPSRVQSVPRTNDRNSSSGSASRRWVGREHGGPHVTHEDHGHEVGEHEPHHDADCGNVAHLLRSTKRRTGLRKRMIGSPIRSPIHASCWRPMWWHQALVGGGGPGRARVSLRCYNQRRRRRSCHRGNRWRKRMTGSMNGDGWGWTAATVAAEFLGWQPAA
jgi:hypothetical protein